MIKKIQQDFSYYSHEFKDNYRKGVHRLRTILESRAQAQAFVSNAGGTAVVLGYEPEGAQMELYRRYISQLFEKLVTCRRFAQIRIPTEANAAESGLDPQDYIRRMDRADEAAFEKIRANVYDIFRTVLSVAEKTCGGEEDAVRDFFARRAQTIPAGWAAAYEKAKEHHDPVRLQIEKLKLDTVGEVRTQFKKIWEGAE